MYKALRGETNYWRRLCANTLTRFADSIDQLVLSWIMYEVTGSASMAALFLFFNHLPTIVLQPFLGVLVDQLPKKSVIMFCDLGRAGIVVCTMIGYYGGMLSPAWLIAITLCISTLEALNRPANTAFYPFLLSQEKYEAGIALDTSISRVAELIGTAAAGVAIGVLGPVGALVIDAAGFLLSAVVTSTIRGNETIEKVKLTFQTYTGQLREGLKVLGGLRTVRWFMVIAAFINFCLSPVNAFQSAYVVDSLRLGPEALSALGIAATLGLGAGAAFAPKCRRWLKESHLTLFSGILQALSMAALWLVPLSPLVWVRFAGMMLAFFVFCFACGVFTVVVQTKMISGIPQQYLARVMSVSSAVAVLMIPLGALLCSGLALILPVASIFPLFGALMLVVYICIAWSQTRWGDSAS